MKPDPRDDDYDDYDGDGTTETWCGLDLPSGLAPAHTAGCGRCREEIGRLGPPPGYSAGAAELGYGGDG